LKDLVEQFRHARSDQSVAVLEGFHPVKHAIRFGAELMVIAIGDPDAVDELATALAPDVVDFLTAESTVVSGDVFNQLVPTPPATSVVAIARRKTATSTEVLAQPGRVVLLENPSRLGNLGAAIRVAAAASAAGVIAIGPHDPWHPEALRGGAGLQFALPIARSDALPNADRPMVALDPNGQPLGTVTIPDDAILAFGSERSGLSDELLGRADLRAAIPMREGVSSLNLATGVAVVLYTLGVTLDR
jgi:TrmH family RNA methyltransferase